MQIDVIGVIGQDFNLIDLISQVEANKEDKEIVLFIDSAGGYTSEGWAIQSYIKSLNEKGYKTIAEGKEVSSIANVIYFECLERRGTEKTLFFWHNAWTELAGADAEEMRQYATFLDVEDKRIASFLAEKTGLEMSTVYSLMEADSFVNYEKAQKLGFFNKRSAPLKIAAYAKPKNKMEQNKIKAAFATFLNTVGINIETGAAGEPDDNDPKNMEITLEDGTALYVYTEDGELEGKQVVLMGEDGEPTDTPAPDGAHRLREGREIVVSGGVITEVREDETEDKKTEEEPAMKKEEVTAMIEEANNKLLAALEEKMQAFKNETEKALIGSITNLAKEVQSKYDPSKKTNFTNGHEDPQAGEQKPFNYGLNNLVKDVKKEREARRRK